DGRSGAALRIPPRGSLSLVDSFVEDLKIAGHGRPLRGCTDAPRPRKQPSRCPCRPDRAALESLPTMQPPRPRLCHARFWINSPASASRSSSESRSASTSSCFASISTRLFYRVSAFNRIAAGGPTLRAKDTTNTRARSGCDDRFARAHRAFATPPFDILYRRWVTDGDSVFDLVSSTAFADALHRGTGRIESQVLPFSYRSALA